jgi:hypothetical protein
VVLSIEERIFRIKYVFQEGKRYIDLVQEQFAEKFPEAPVPHHNVFRRITEKFRETGSVLDAERNERPYKLNDKKLMDIYVQTLVDITSNTPFEVRSDFSNTLYFSYITFWTST